MANEEEEELLGVIKDVKGFLKRFVQYLKSPQIFKKILFMVLVFEKRNVKTLQKKTLEREQKKVH